MADLDTIETEEREFYFHDLRLVALVITVACFLLVYVILLPILKFRLASTMVFLSSLGSGAAVIYCLLIPDWLVGSVTISSPLSYWSPHKIYDIEVGVHIGLIGTNITLNAVYEDYRYNSYSEEEYVYFDEFFRFGGVDHMAKMSTEAKLRGLPGPVLTVIDYLSSGAIHGFEWPYRMVDGGYYCVWLLSGLLALWIYLHVLFIAVTRYGVYVYTAYGFLLFFCNFIYWCMLPKTIPRIIIEGKLLNLQLGACYYTCFSLGMWCSASGLALIFYDYRHPNCFITNFNMEEEEIWQLKLHTPKQVRQVSKILSPRTRILKLPTNLR